jgi:hypothetical protein
MIELRNLRKLHGAQKVRIALLHAENKKLKERVAFLETVYGEQQKVNGDLRLQMEELRTIVFGKKRHHDHDDTPPPPKIPRTADSYHRRVPNDTDITEEKHHPIDSCTHCGGVFTERDSTVYWQEDIPIPQKKAVIRHTIEKGYCTHCRKWSTGAPLPYAHVVLGTTVKRYVVYLSVVGRLSYAQMQDILKQTYDFDISQGEIAKIMEQEGTKLQSAYEQLHVQIRGEPSVHLDETSWNLVLGDGYRRYAWTMTGGATQESVYLLGKTRGKGNATDLLGDSMAVVTSDDYGAYRTLANPHQLCCAHILRKLRDLAESSKITGSVHDHCVTMYQTCPPLPLPPHAHHTYTMSI